MHGTPENGRVVYKDPAISTLKSAHKSENRSKKASKSTLSWRAKTTKTFSRFRFLGFRGKWRQYSIFCHENRENVFPFSHFLKKPFSFFQARKPRKRFPVFAKSWKAFSRFPVFAYFLNFAFSFSFLREKENENEHVFPFFVFVADPWFRWWQHIGAWNYVLMF